MQKMVQALPQYRDQMEKLSLHIDVSWIPNCGQWAQRAYMRKKESFEKDLQLLYMSMALLQVMHDQLKILHILS